MKAILCVLACLFACALCAAPAVEQPQGSVECAVCNWIVQELDSWIQSNSTEREIEKVLQKICTVVPKQLESVCDSFVEEYTPALIALLVRKVQPEVICSHLGLCAKTVEVEGSIECTVCHWIMQQLEDYITKPATEEEIVRAVERVCKTLPSIAQGPCTTLVEKYGPQLIQMLVDKENPETVCAQLGLCKAVVAPVVEDKVQCAICKWILVELESWIASNTTEAEIIKLVEKTCDRVPASLKPTCIGFIENYGQLVIDMLIQRLDPNVVCEKLGLCQPTFATPAATIQCTVCNWVMAELEKLLTTGATEAEIAHALEKVCTFLPKTVQPMCNQFIEEYTPIILEMLVRKADPATVCAALGLCPKKLEQENDIKCAVCEWVMTELEKLVQENATEAAVAQALEKVCMLLPTSVRAMCNNLVDEYTPVIIQLIVARVPPAKVCQAVGLCGKAVVEPENDIKCAVCEWVMAELDSLLEKNSTETEIIKALEGVCKFLPSSLTSFCHNFVEEYAPIIVELLVKKLDPARVCSVIGLCGKTVEVEAPQPVTGLKCATCEFVVSAIDDLLEKNATETQIEHVLEKVCTFIPDSLRKYCDDLIEEYTPVLIELFVKDVTPEKICTILRLCGAAAVEVPKPNGVQCAVCEWVVAELESLLEKNTTEAEIARALTKVCSLLPSSLTGMCNNFVEEYTPVLIELFVKKVSPDKICTIMHLCAASAPRANADRPHNEGNDIKCAVCEWVMAELEKLIQENTTEAGIATALEKVCMLLPTSVRAMCNNLVDEYTPVIIEMILSKIPPTKVCQAVGLCGKAAPAPEASPIVCFVCDYVMTELEKIITSNASEAEIEKALGKVCTLLPKSLKSACDSLVGEYTPMIVKLLLEAVTPQKICSMIGLCDAAGEPIVEAVAVDMKCVLCEWVMEELDKLVEGNATQAQIEKAVERVCTFLPKTVQPICNQFIEEYTPILVDLLVKDFPPEKVCAAIHMCPKTQPKKVSLEENGVQCAVCEWVVAELESLLEKNTTQAEIEKALGTVCALLPSSLTALCNNFVQQYTPVLIELLLKQIPPNKICTIMGLCAAVPLPEPNSVQCAVCEWVISEVEGLLVKNTTEAEIAKALEKVCTLLPSSLRATCDGFVEEYTPVLVELLVKQVAPEKICSIIGLCKASVMAQVSLDIKCPACKFIVSEIDDLLGTQRTKQGIVNVLDKVCAKLPASLKPVCESLIQEYTPMLIDMLIQKMDPARICAAIKMCPKNVGRVGGIECAVCEWVITELDNLLKSNRTEAAIEAALGKVCNLLPSSLSGMCTDFVATYGPALIELLVQKVDPPKICGFLGMCAKQSVAVSFQSL